MSEKYNHDWEKMVKEQQESGKSIKDFCAEKGFKENTFYTRRKKLRELKFIRILPKKQESGKGELTVKYGELSILVGPDTCLTTLQSLFSLLGIIK